jgi:gibberellin 2-oxidase
MSPALTIQRPDLPHWEQPAKTSEKLQWANIKTIDLSTFDQPGGKQKLAADLRDAVHQLTLSHDRTG